MVYGKTVCKGLFSDGIYICGMHFNWSVVSETEFYGYEYCNHIYSGGFDYFDCDRWLSLQCGRLFLKCIFILFFSDRTKDVISNLCSGISGYPCHYAAFLRDSRNTGCKIENACQTISTAGISHADSVWHGSSAAKGKKWDRNPRSYLYTADTPVKPQHHGICCGKWNFIRRKAFFRGKREHRGFSDTGRTTGGQMDLWKQTACRRIHTVFLTGKMLISGNSKRE